MFDKCRYLLGISSIILALVSGCGSEGSKDPQIISHGEVRSHQEPPSSSLMRELIEEAAKGRAADPVKLKKIFHERILGSREAHNLSTLEVDGENFLCLLTKLKAVEQVADVTSAFLDKLLIAKEVANAECKSSERPIDRLLDAARAGDESDELDKMITAVAKKGGENAIKRADDQAKSERLLNAVNKQKDRQTLREVFTHLPIFLRSETIKWATDHQGDSEVLQSFRDSNRLITNEKLLKLVKDAVPRPVDAAKLAKLKLYYDLAIKGDPSGVQGHNLSTTADTSGAKFSQYLGQVLIDPAVFAIWQDLLEQNFRFGGALAYAEAVTTRVGALERPIRYVLREPDNAQREKLVHLMVAKNAQGVMDKLEVPDLAIVFTALRKEGRLAELNKALAAGLRKALLRHDTLNWATTNRALAIVQEPGATVAQALAGAISPGLVVNVGNTGNIANLRFLYESFVTDPVKAGELARHEELGPLPGRFILALTTRPTNAHTAWMLNDFLNKLLPIDAVAQANLSWMMRTPMSNLLEPRPRLLDDEDQKKTMIARLARTGQAAVRLASDRSMLKGVLTAVLEKDAGNITTVIGQVNQATMFEGLVVWLYENRATASVQAAADALITYTQVVDAAAARFDLLHFSYLYQLKVTTGDKARLLAQEPPSMGPPYRFINFLANWRIGRNIAAIFDHFLTVLAAFPGEPALQANLAGAGGITPLGALWAAGRAPDAPMERRQVIAKLAVVGGAAAVAQAIDRLKLEELLSAVLANDNANLGLVIGRVALGRQVDLLQWLYANQASAAVLTAAQNHISNDMIIAEAKSLAPRSHVLAWLYFLKIQNEAAAWSLAQAIPLGGGDDRFINLLSRLTIDQNIRDIYEHFFANLPPLQIASQANYLPGAGPSPMAELLDPARLTRVPTDTANFKKEVITLLAEKGGQPAVSAADDGAKLSMLLQAVAMTKFSIFGTVVGQIDRDARLDDLIDFVEGLVGASVVGVSPAFHALIGYDMIVDEAAKGPLADVDKLEKLYFFKMDTLTGGDVVALAGEPSTTVLNADRFINFMVRLPSSPKKTEIIEDFFGRLDEVEAANQANFVGAGLRPMAELLAIPVVDPDKQAIITELASAGGEQAIRLADDDAKLSQLLDAVLANGNRMIMRNVFKYSDPLLFDPMVAWAMNHRVNNFIIGALIPTNTVRVAMCLSHRITDDEAKAEAIKNPPNWKKLLFYVQVKVTNDASGKRLAEIAHGGQSLHQHLVGKPQTEESVKVLEHYAHYLATDWPAKRDEALAIFDDPAHPDRAHLDGPAAHPAKEALRLFRDDAGNLEPAPPAGDPVIVNEGP